MLRRLVSLLDSSDEPSERAPRPDARAALLAEFVSARDPTSLAADAWRAALGAPHLEVVKSLVTAGLLGDAPLAQRIATTHSGADLKAIAKRYGVPSSGTKVTVAERLALKAPSEMAALATASIIICTEAGHSLAESYRRAQREERETAERLVLDHLRASRWREAALEVARYEQTRIVPRGLGIDWRRYDPEQDVERLRRIFGEIPASCAMEAVTAPIGYQLAAAMMCLWGTNYRAEWTQMLGLSPDVGDPAVKSRMVLFGATQGQQLDHMFSVEKELGPDIIVEVKVSCAGDARSCDACRAISGRHYRRGAVPALPHFGCTSAMGCRCSYTFQVARR